MGGQRADDAVGGDRESPGRLRRLAIALTWVFGLMFVPLIAVIAAADLVVTFGPALAGSFRAEPDRATAGVWAGIAVASAAFGALIAAFRLQAGRLESWLLPFGLALLVVTRILALALVHPPLVSDWLTYYRLAQHAAGSGPLLAAIPTGYPMLAGLFFRIFGANVMVGELINLAASTVTGLLIYRLAADLWGPRAGGLALCLYAVSIAQLLMITVFCTELVFAALILAAVLVTLRAAGSRGRTGLLLAALSGVTLGLAQYVRVDAEVLLPAFLLMPLLRRLPARRAVALAAVSLAAFLVVLGPVVAWNRTTYGTWSFSTSNYGGWSLLVGTDPGNTGQWNAADQALVTAGPTTRAFNDQLFSLAIDRLRARPDVIPGLVAGKLIPMWGNENYAAVWTLDQADPGVAGARSAIAISSQIMYVVILAAAAAAIWSQRKRRPEFATAFILVVGATALAHAFLEVQPRYHFYVEPMLCILAAGWLATRFGSERAGADTAARAGG